MKRSKSSLTQKQKKQIKYENRKTKHKALKIQTINTIQTTQNNPVTQRPQTSRNTFEQRLNKIRQGFQDLQNNLNFNSHNKTDSQKILIQHNTSHKKIAKKLFSSESNKKTQIKNKSKDKIVKTSRKKSQAHFSPMKLTPRNNNNYHSCVYEKSLFDLMKIVVVQRNQIQRLNSQIRLSRKKK